MVNLKILVCGKHSRTIAGQLDDTDCRRKDIGREQTSLALRRRAINSSLDKRSPFDFVLDARALLTRRAFPTRCASSHSQGHTVRQVCMDSTASEASEFMITRQVIKTPNNGLIEEAHSHARR